MAYTTEDFRAQLSAEPSRKNTDFIIFKAGNSQENFDRLVEIILDKNPVLSARASWVAEGICAIYPGLVRKHIPALVKALPKFRHDGARRNVLKLLSRESMPEKQLGTLTDHCFSFLSDPDRPVAVKMYSMLILSNMLDKYPELANELTEIIEDQYERSSPGFKSIARKVMLRIRKL